MLSRLPSLSDVVREPEDDMTLACGIAGDAEVIVTRDKDLLTLGSYRGVVILSVGGRYEP